VQATAWASLLGVAAAGCAFQSADEQDLARAPADQRFDSVRSEIANDVASGVLQSLAIGVIDRGEIVWAEAFGSADAEAGIPATVATPYCIASMESNPILPFSRNGGDA
jgi:CubicO group peptidase (beta-lactamase class C family)